MTNETTITLDTPVTADALRAKIATLIGGAFRLVEAETGATPYELAFRQLDGRVKTRGDWFKVHMPYRFEPLDHSGHVYLPLNRLHKPLGMTTRKWLDYAEFRHMASHFRPGPGFVIESGIWFMVLGDSLYLYGDSVSSRKDYFARLGKLIGKYTDAPCSEA
jgi:hypothetical protein